MREKNIHRNSNNEMKKCSCLELPSKLLPVFTMYKITDFLNRICADQIKSIFQA